MSACTSRATMSASASFALLFCGGVSGTMSINPRRVLAANCSKGFAPGAGSAVSF